MRLLREIPLLSTALAVSLLALGTSAQGAAATELPDLSTATLPNGRTSANTLRTSAVTNTNTNTGTGTSIALTGPSTGTTTAPVPKLTTSATSDSGLPALPTNLPTLTGIATIVTPVVPNTKQAPFMQQSTMPDGTVFIVVGAILGFMAMSVLLWRGLVAWSLHRSVKRAAQAQHTAMNDTKTLFRPGPTQPQFYKYSDRESTISLGAMGHKSGKKVNRNTSTAGVSAGASTTSNLFFSPTAGAATAGLAAGSRGSSYLPSGYYAAGAAQAGGGQSHIPLGHQPASSISTFSQTQGYPRASRMGETPPDSPAYGQSSSTVDSNRGHGGQERAPSVFLDELFDGENGPPVPWHGGHRRGNSAPRY
ncbi:hypothetical protein N431DRAFT_433240 [Stipitochalara longipes BDJ]|nr:hypothetical protein N431DRAFT_433240 [Stipitochalara longipes BDJ]